MAASAGDLIALLAPNLVRHFQGRALIDFRVVGPRRSTLRITLDFPASGANPSDVVETLISYIEAIGAQVHKAVMDRSRAWVELSRAAPFVGPATIVPFPARA
jgi:hypothetical protein